MTSKQSPAAVDGLEELEKLGADEYIIAAGPGGRQFYGTSGGYSTVHLPVDLLSEVKAGLVKKIIWASFGSSEDSWFFSLETNDGDYAFRIGTAAPSALQQYIKQISISKLHLESLRVQLGDNDSFLVWSRSSWAASGIPRSLLDKLRSISVCTRDWDGVTKGAFRKVVWPLGNIQWSRTGSFYLQCNDQHMGDWEAKAIREAWSKFWQGGRTKALRLKIQEELAYVAIDPHASDGDAFVFFKKQQADEEAAYIMGFSGGETHTNLGSQDEPQPAETSMQRICKTPEEPTDVKWATCKKSGRPHRAESWELVVERGEVVKVVRDMGRDWFIVQGKENMKGWVHSSWLDFGDSKVHTDSASAYAQFREDLDKVLVAGQMRSFPDMRTYMDTCTQVNCQILKEHPGFLGICSHDLLALLQGSGKYSKGWLKEGRNLFHPDRFARFCHAEHVEGLKLKAEQLFVLFGILMDRA